RKFPNATRITAPIFRFLISTFPSRSVGGLYLLSRGGEPPLARIISIEEALHVRRKPFFDHSPAQSELLQPVLVSTALLSFVRVEPGGHALPELWCERIPELSV